MPLFNRNKSGKNRTVNLAGGKAFTRSPEYQLVSMLLTNFVQNTYYRSAEKSLEQLEDLLQRVDPRFAAKAAIYARHEFGMRSITHALAAMLAKQLSGTDFGAGFFDKVVRRPDDMLEITAAYASRNQGNTKLTNAMKRGFAAAFDRFDGYQLAKYRGAGKEVKLIDIVNLVHPVPTQRNAAALQALVNDTLRNTQTWEAKLTAAGQQKDTEQAKTEAWSELLREGKLGYFALIRNLRNILEQAPETIDLVETQLTDEKRIRASLVLPFRLLTAYKQIQSTDANSRRVLAALEKAIEISIDNIPVMPNTLVAVDNSGSMHSPVGASTHILCNELGAVFGMALAKRSNADLMEFGTTARYIDYRLNDSVLEFAAKFERNNQVGHGTSFEAIFKTARKAYDRIVIFSDMQAWLGKGPANEALNDYRSEWDTHPFVYAIDLRGYSTSQFPENKVFELAGFSEKIFGMMGVLEQEPDALIKAIEAVEL